MGGGISGVGDVVKNLRAANDRMRKGAAKGLGLATRNTLNVSNRQVPHEEGDLERDGKASVDDAQLIGAVAYGTTEQTRDYAVPQHERLDFKHDGGRNAKYLENAINSTI